MDRAGTAAATLAAAGALLLGACTGHQAVEPEPSDPATSSPTSDDADGSADPIDVPAVPAVQTRTPLVDYADGRRIRTDRLRRRRRHEQWVPDCRAVQHERVHLRRV